MIFIFANSSLVAESKTGPVTLNFVLDLTSAPTTPITVDYVTKDITAVAGTDYIAASGTLTFPPGSLSATVPITILAEGAVTTNKCFYFSLSNPVGAILATPLLAGVIFPNPNE